MTPRERNAKRMREQYKDNPQKFRDISRANRKANPESITARRARMFRSRYNITLEDFVALAEKQENKCAICGSVAPLTIDHCHKSGKVRGLLCGNCNRGIGCLKESIDNLKNAIKYLLFHCI